MIDYECPDCSESPNYIQFARHADRFTPPDNATKPILCMIVNCSHLARWNVNLFVTMLGSHKSVQVLLCPEHCDDAINGTLTIQSPQH
jgi:hypothetical protein